MSDTPPDEVEIPSQDDLNRLLFAEMMTGHRAARRSRRFVRIIVFAAVAYFAAGGYLVDRQNARINAGRKVSSNVVCAFGGALAEAGRAVLDAGAAAPKGARARRFERELERIGYPPRSQRQGAGQAYVDNVATRVEQKTRIEGLVIRRGPKAGTLDCAKLQRAAKIK